jgi:hypothetical protein
MNMKFDASVRRSARDQIDDSELTGSVMGGDQGKPEACGEQRLGRIRQFPGRHVHDCTPCALVPEHPSLRVEPAHNATTWAAA